MSIQARHPGTCPECGGRFQPGDLICSADADLPYEQRRRPTIWRHVSCPDDPADPSLKPGEQVCQACWLVHPPATKCSEW